MIRQPIANRGIIAGILAGTTIVLWFLIADLLVSYPFRTPAFLAQILFGLEELEIAPLPIVGYTILHYAVFILLGQLIARLSARLHPRAYLLLGFVVGFFLFDLLFYGSLFTTGVNVIEAFGWPVILAGNILAGIVLMEYLRLSGPRRAPGWGALLREHQVLRRGVVGGLLAATAVALSFLIIDLVFRQALFTPGALGSVILFGAGSPAEIQVTGATVLSYTMLHYAAFLAIGIAVAALVTRAEDHPALLLGVILAFVTFEALFIGLVAISAAWILDTLGWWNVLIGNVVATVAMVGYLAREHPALLRLLTREPLEAPR